MQLGAQASVWFLPLPVASVNVMTASPRPSIVPGPMKLMFFARRLLPLLMVIQFLQPLLLTSSVPQTLGAPPAPL